VFDDCRQQVDRAFHLLVIHYHLEDVTGLPHFVAGQADLQVLAALRRYSEGGLVLDEVTADVRGEFDFGRLSAFVHESDDVFLVGAE